MKDLMAKDREYFLSAAQLLINGPRAKEYGPARKNHQRIADMWTILLDSKLRDVDRTRGSGGLHGSSEAG